MNIADLHISSLILQTIALLITAFLLPRFQVHGPLSGFIMVAALTFINTNLWDAALFYSIPNTLSTQAAITFCTNAVLFWVLAKTLPGIEIQGILPAFIAPVVLTGVSLLTYKYGRDIDWMHLINEFQNSFRYIKSLSKVGQNPS